ncbi:MAG: flavodoxin [Oscillospiraceae bacterium]
MKAIVIYYSLEGNTELVAQEIAKNTGAELFRLVPEKQYPDKGIAKFFWGGKSVMFGDKPALKNPVPDLSEFDTVFVGTPVWAGSFAPPLNTFLSGTDLSGKNVAFFVCCGGGSTEKCFQKLGKAAEGANILNRLDFVDPRKADPAEVACKVKNYCSALELWK